MSPSDLGILASCHQSLLQRDLLQMAKLYFRMHMVQTVAGVSGRSDSHGVRVPQPGEPPNRATHLVLQQVPNLRTDEKVSTRSCGVSFATLVAILVRGMSDGSCPISVRRL